MSALLLSVLTASFLGSLHCVGMCGPFVGFYAAAGAGRAWAPHLAYSAGRLATYLTLGALAGALGAAVDLAGSAADVKRAAALLCGGVMVLWGVASLLAALGVGRASLGGAAPRFMTRAARNLAQRPPVIRALAMGLLTTFLPCGWLYAFAVAAAATGRVSGGALVMAAFWLGTVPALLGLGAGVQRLAEPLRRRLPALTAAALIVVGLLTLTGRLGVDRLPRMQDVDLNASVQRIDALGESPDAPCCQDEKK